MSFDFRWFQKRNKPAVYSEFSNFLEKIFQLSYVDKKLRFKKKKFFKPNKKKFFRKYVAQQHFKFFCKTRSPAQLNNFFDVFFWVRFMQMTTFNFQSSIFYLNKINPEFRSKSHSVLFVPLNQKLLKVSRILKYRRRRKGYSLRKKYLSLLLKIKIQEAVLHQFFFFLFSSQIFRIFNRKFSDDYDIVVHDKFKIFKKNYN